MKRVRSEGRAKDGSGLADLELVNEDGDGIELVVLLRIHGGRLKL